MAWVALYTTIGTFSVYCRPPPSPWIKAAILWNLNYSHDKIVVSLVFRFHNSSAETIRIYEYYYNSRARNISIVIPQYDCNSP